MTAGGVFHSQIEARVSDAEESLRRISPNVRFAAGTDLRHRLSLDGDDRFTLVRLQFAGELSATNAPDETITISFAPTGWMQWAIGHDRGAATLPWMQSTDQQTSARFGPVDEIAAFLMKQPLLSFGRALFGDDRFRLTFDGPWPVTDGHGSYLAGLLTSMQAVAATPAFDQPILRATLYRQLAVSVLSGFRLQGDAVVRRVTAEGRLRRYRIAAQFIDDYVSLPITVEDAAQAAGVSTSDLDQIFRGHSPIGQGVRAHLRLARLAAAHTDLVDGDPTTGDTVRDIAHRWGFADPSTFAKQYRRLYGVSPKWVLDR